MAPSTFYFMTSNSVGFLKEHTRTACKHLQTFGKSTFRSLIKIFIKDSFFLNFLIPRKSVSLGYSVSLHGGAGSTSFNGGDPALLPPCLISNRKVWMNQTYTAQDAEHIIKQNLPAVASSAEGEAEVCRSEGSPGTCKSRRSVPSQHGSERPRETPCSLAPSTQAKHSH